MIGVFMLIFFEHLRFVLNYTCGTCLLNIFKKTQKFAQHLGSAFAKHRLHLAVYGVCLQGIQTNHNL